MRKTSYNGSQSELANRTMTVTPNVKFQNVERLNTIVGQVTQRNKQTAIRSVRTGMSDKVLDLIKHRIKSNYDKLYENYDDNKKTILKQIQHVETNMAGQNTVSKGFENVIKEKSHYDKTKAELESKQKKFKKIIQVRDQLRLTAEQHLSLEDVLTEKCALLQNLDNFSKTLDYQTSVLNNMKTDRRSIKLTLKERYDKMMRQEQSKKERMIKLQNGNHTKHTMLMRIQQSLRKQDQCQIPQNLAQQLQKKLQEYQGKHTYQNIIKHQNQISQQNKKIEEEQAIRDREEAKRIRIAKQKEEIKQYQMAYNFFLIKQQEEEKIKKICGVSSLGQIANNNFQADYENLGVIKEEITRQTKRVKLENQKIKKDIQQILEKGAEDFTEENLQSSEKQCLQAEKQFKRYQNHWDNRQPLFNQWHSMIQTMNANHGSVKKQNIGQALRQILDRLKKEGSGNQSQSNFESFDIEKMSLPETLNTKFKKMRQQYQSECSILQNDMI